MEMPSHQLFVEKSNNDCLRETSYQKKAEELIKLINSLRETGTHFVLDLPTVCVCGNQSAGKSSVMEGLSGITLPRSNGTCTRCPMEVSGLLLVSASILVTDNVHVSL
jgi:hypothetical protein